MEQSVSRLVRPTGKGWRRRTLVWLVVVPLVVVTAVALVMRFTGILGWDAPAHLYKIALVRDGASMLWDNLWYGGAYQTVSYGFVFYWLARYVGPTVLVVASAGSLPVMFYLYMRRIYDVTSFVPALVLAGVMAVYLANGQDPFLFALALTMAGLTLAAYDHTALAVPPLAVAAFVNPLGSMIGGIFLVAQAVSEPERRPRLLRLAVYLAPFVAARVVLGWFFWERASYFYRPIEIVIYVLFGVVGATAARMSGDPRRRSKEILFLTFAVVALLAAAVPPNPVGGNFGRFFFVFGVPLLLCVRRPALPRAVVVPLVAAIAFGQLVVPASHFVRAADLPSNHAAFFTPAVVFAAGHNDPDYRFHVVALSTHSEAYFFPLNGLPITRGWYRQDDALHNELLNSDSFTEVEYVAWLRGMAVHYVFLPAGRLDLSGARERDMLYSSSHFRLVTTLPGWTVFALDHPEPMLEPLSGTGRGHMLSVGHDAVYLRVTAPGLYLVKVSYSPFWRVTDGVGAVRGSPDGFLELRASSAGFYGLRVQVTPHSLWKDAVSGL